MPSLRLATGSALLGIGAAVLPLPAQTPTALDRIPVYPGATRQLAREQEEYASDPGRRIYVVRAPIEEVIRFYQQRLHAQEIKTEDERDRAWDTYERLAAGQVSGVTMLLDVVDLTPAWFAKNSESEEDPAKQAAAWRAAYTQKRPPLRPNTWVHAADFAWGAAQPTGPVAFMVTLEDIGAWQIREPEYFHETEIEFGTQTMGPQVAEAQEEPEEEAPVKPMAAPSTAELGVPLYPGAKFDGRISAEMSRSDEEANYYVYSSTDTPEQVAAFYRTRTGKAGITTPGGVMFAIRGEGLFPDLGLTVQPNAGTFPAPAKTMLTIRKKR
jgi:hypothetical protein